MTALCVIGAISSHQARDREIISAYKSGLSLRECANRFGLSLERIRQILNRDDPEAIRRHLYCKLRRKRSK